MDLLGYTFLVKSALAVLLTGLITGIIGSLIVVRRMVFISGGITHSSFAGLGFGFFMGWSPTLCAMAAAIISGVGVEWMSQKGRVREDSAIAAVWSIGMALGILFTFLTPGYKPGLSSFLFGNILLVSDYELWLLLGYLIISLLILFFWYKPILYVSFDPIHARIRRVPTALINYLIMIWLSVGIVLSIRVVGIMMLMSMLTIPQMTVGQFSFSLKQIIIGSSLLSVLAVLGSLYVSFYWNLPTGALAVLLLSLIFVITRGFHYIRVRYA